MEGIHINVWYIIAMEMRDRAQQEHTSLLFPMLVTNMCHNASVPEIGRIDENIWVNQVVDITKIQDEMNPKLKKRKKELVVSHTSGTTMDVHSRAVDELIVDAMPSSATLVAPQLDQSIFILRIVQRAIDMALSLLHIKIQYLEHRVYELEGIGVRDALEALKPDMSKVKTNVHQLHPDISIFDALLPEDEAFEDERAKIDKEEL
ncbi:hypothetical protein HAX54_049613 [Datura stramonium]|uniref:Uncharacterized protein n=1 Tax=Datura stramonium TaxID=4076 RepID=A0ABS8SV44_DATST|nr:hypothetical protein [Datura stramonium]